LRFLKRSALVVIIVLAITVAVNLVFPQLELLKEYAVDSPSMEPTLHCANAADCRSLRDDRLLVSDIPYIFHDPSRGDIVIVNLGRRHHTCSSSVIVKRIVGLPRDTIEQTHGILRLNGEVPKEPYLLPSGSRGPNFAERILGSGQYFVMGDNRSNSCDSREFGPIRRSEIIGKVIGVNQL
jgi:signal peptidase I